MEDLHFPFADLEELDRFKNLSNVVHYEMARKIALLEMQLSGHVQDLNWNGYHLSEKPMLIYDLESTPRFYDFIALDVENNPIGTLRVNATKNQNSVIKNIFTKTLNYNEMLSKSSVSTPSFFVDWKGTEFIGVKSKFGDTPTQITSIETGDIIAQNEIKELKNDEIIDVITKMLSEFHKENNQPIDINVVRDSMLIALEENIKGAEAYWQSMEEIEDELMEVSDEEINNSNSKFFGRIRRWFSRKVLKTDETPYVIDKYHNERFNYRPGNGFWCGPWVCGYILWVNEQVDRYEEFLSHASTRGEMFIPGAVFRWFGGRPMTPDEMHISMHTISQGRITISPKYNYRSDTPYQHIKHQRPAIRLCATGGELHWTVCYGAKKTGPVVWRRYEFREIDNGAKVGKSGDFVTPDWWNVWLLVHY
ncbi:hypothetical protein [Capnocytophaga sp.]|uniref:hypothetical protein n=1 Tax=Capnocytophaga sp. TaxID=44737 RepID=UPI0026DD24C6|nr:hypothetical protein [Capnocytophaga sp.]MDO5105505.1 hypothetical protein [Capnocytophaga sp.]